MEIGLKQHVRRIRAQDAVGPVVLDDAARLGKDRPERRHLLRRVFGLKRLTEIHIHRDHIVRAHLAAGIDRKRVVKSAIRDPVPVHWRYLHEQRKRNGARRPQQRQFR